MAMDLQAKLSLTDAFTSSLRNAIRTMDSVERTARQIDQGFGDMTRSASRAADQMNGIGDNASDSASDVSRLEREMDQVGQELTNASRGADNLENNLGDAGRTGASAGDKIAGAFKIAAGIFATVFAVDKIKDFAGGAIEAAAEAAATSAQYSEVFGDLESDATKRLQAIGDESTILTNRMKGSFTKMAAFAKVGGMDTADSLDLADRSMRAIADSAAFYDQSLETTTESLQSFLKGKLVAPRRCEAA